MKHRKLDKIKNKRLFIITLIVSVFFISLFLYLKEKNKFNFRNALFVNTKSFKKKDTDYLNGIIYDYKNSVNIKSVSDLEKEKLEKELNYKSVKDKIKAKSYLILDLKQKRFLISEKENEILPLASITKLMTAYTALNYCNDDLKLKLDKILIASDNESSDYVANNCPNYEDFINNMNYLAKKNNLNMSFINPSGLDIKDETEASNFGTASSVANLINLLYEKNSSILSHTTKINYEGIRNTNNKVISTPFLIGSKTGYTDIAGGNLVTIYEIGPNSRFAIVVLGSTKEERFTDTDILLNYFLENH